MIVRALREAHWLRPDRAWFYGLLAVLFSAITACGALAGITRPWRMSEVPATMAVDFVEFWAGARLALAGHPAAAYNAGEIAAQEAKGAQLQKPAGQYWPYLYPPVFLLMSLPLGLLPYLPAMGVFTFAGYAAFFATVRRILQHPWPIWTIVAFPTAFSNAVVGQNGLFTASCFAGALVTLDRRPMLAGALLGVLVYKPHMAVLAPLCLLAARRFAALAACAGMAGGLLMLSWAMFGTGPWLAFFDQGPVVHFMLSKPAIVQAEESFYGFAMQLGASQAAALAVQIGVALAVSFCLMCVAWRRPGGRAEIAALAAATQLCPPHVMTYDLACLAVPMAWLADSAARSGWLAWEKVVLAGLFIYLDPWAAWVGDHIAGLPLTPVLMSALLVLVVLRIGTSSPMQQKAALAAC